MKKIKVNRECWWSDVNVRLYSLSKKKTSSLKMRNKGLTIRNTSKPDILYNKEHLWRKHIWKNYIFLFPKLSETSFSALFPTCFVRFKKKKKGSPLLCSTFPFG